MNRPDKNEYASYYERYVSLVKESDIVAALETQQLEFLEIFKEIAEEKGVFRYEAGKWSIKELIGHLIDGERIFAYRALRFARADKTPVEGFEQDDYIANADFDAIRLDDLIAEFSLLRQANILFFRNLSDEIWSRTGTASNAEVSVRALAYIMAGHVRHHLKILQARYLAS
jgi:hypothetical protein